MRNMKKIMIGLVAGVCVLMTSCGNMSQVLSAMTNGTGVVNAPDAPSPARIFWPRQAVRWQPYRLRRSSCPTISKWASAPTTR